MENRAITSPIGYVLEGVDKILLLNFEDFGGVYYKPDGSGLVERIIRQGRYTPVVARSEAAKLTSEYSAGIYTHTLEAYLDTITSGILADCHAATARKYIVLLRIRSGGWYLIGIEAGAAMVYKAGTVSGAGILLTISTQSTHPLLGVAREAIEGPNYRVRYIPDFAWSFCHSAADGVTQLPFHQAAFSKARADPGGEALDRNGERCEVSGLKQAAICLEGRPVPSCFEKVGTFGEGASVDGFPTVIYNVWACPIDGAVHLATTEGAKVGATNGGHVVVNGGSN